MTLDTFIAVYNGGDIDFDHALGYQCMDLMHQYIWDVHGLPGGVLNAPTAYKAYIAGDAHFDRYSYEYGLMPQRGDIIFWDTAVGPSGHVAVYLEGDLSRFTSFDQNWPLNSGCHIQPHTYRGVVGWLRLKDQLTKEDMQLIDELRKELESAVSRIETLEAAVAKIKEKKASKKFVKNRYAKK